MSLEAPLRRIAADLDALGTTWAVVGALGVAAWAEARATLDVDVAVAVADAAEATALVEGLRRRGYRWDADFGAAMTRLVVPDGPPAGLRLDLLFSLAGIEDHVARGGVRLEVLPGLEMRVARRGDLLALKLLACDAPGREHDLRDARALAAGAAPDDVDRARGAIGLVRARGLGDAERMERTLERLVAESRAGGSRLE